MREDLVLSIDLGTTGNRAIVFDRSLRMISQSYLEFRQIYPEPGWVEHDPLEILRTTREVIRRALSRIDSKRLRCVGITNQRETVVVWDKTTGKPIHNAIVWQCRRTTNRCQELKKQDFGQWIHQRTGLFLDPYFSATKIEWLLDHVPGARARAKSGRLLSGTIDSWILWNLTQGRVHATDPSNASRTMLLSLKKADWDAELCRTFRIPTALLPSLKPTCGEFGLTDRTLFGRSVPVTAMVGDQQAASFAQGCFKKGIVKNTYGTGLFLMESTGSKPVFSENLLSTILWQMNGRVEYALEGAVFIGGAAVQWLRDGLKIINKSSDTEALAKSLRSNDGVYFVPALVGLGVPYWDPNARGAIFGITRGTTRAHLARATLESIAYQTKDIVSVMEKESHRPLKILQVDGGASQNDYLMQFQADMLGIPVERPKILETTALGAAGLSGIASGIWRDRDTFLSLRRVDKVFKPRMNLKEREKLYSRWKEAVRRALEWE